MVCDKIGVMEMVCDGVCYRCMRGCVTRGVGVGVGEGRGGVPGR